MTMPYKPLSEILADLDAQQRRELAALVTSVDTAEVERMRNLRKQLSTVATFFIERSWEVIAPRLEGFSLEAASGKSPKALREYLTWLRHREPAAAWGWTRARMDARLMELLEACVPDLLRQHPEMAALYLKTLRRAGKYWFRETPLHHLKAGYHTALGVACKWYGSALEARQDVPASCPHSLPDFSGELRQFASFSLTMLARTDRYLWDSAGAAPMEAVWEAGNLSVVSATIAEIDLVTAPDYGLRLGCPALRARGQSGTPAFQGMIDWVEQVFSRYLLEGEATPSPFTPPEKK
jgi:hypothetical protein